MTLREWLHEAPFTLTLSSGFFGFFAHCGVMLALEDAGILPSALSGSSAGALVAGLWASGLDAEAMRRELLGLTRERFWDPGFGPGLLRGRLFRQLLDEALPRRHFVDCRARLGVSVYDVLSARTRVITSGEIAPAIQASCSVPVMFHPTWIDGRPLWDGGILDRPGLAGVPQGARVLYHHLASRSPWRRRQSPALRVPRRQDLVGVVVRELPRLGPFRLAQAPAALEQAQAAMHRALDLPLSHTLEVS